MTIPVGNVVSQADAMQSVNTLIRTAEFAEWLRRLKDAKGKARIISRLDAAEMGTSVTANRSAKASVKCASTPVPAIGCTLRDMEESFTCCC